MHDVTEQIALEIVSHEAIVREAYKDSVGVWTWSVGITTSSGHKVLRYKDNPQTIARCLEVFVWLLKTKYAPDVEEAFEGFELTEAQFGAALSFHYNTGAIHRANWVKLWKQDDVNAAKRAFMQWRKPKEIIPRRKKERDLFFDGVWSNNGRATIFPVKKQNHQPDFTKGVSVDIREALRTAMREREVEPKAVNVPREAMEDALRESSRTIQNAEQIKNEGFWDKLVGAGGVVGTITGYFSSFPVEVPILALVLLFAWFVWRQIRKDRAADRIIDARVEDALTGKHIGRSHVPLIAAVEAQRT